MLLCKNRRLFTVAGDNSHVLSPIPMHLIPIPIPIPWLILLPFPWDPWDSSLPHSHAHIYTRAPSTNQLGLVNDWSTVHIILDQATWGSSQLHWAGFMQVPERCVRRCKCKKAALQCTALCVWRGLRMAMSPQHTCTCGSAKLVNMTLFMCTYLQYRYITSLRYQTIVECQYSRSLRY